MQTLKRRLLEDLNGGQHILLSSGENVTDVDDRVVRGIPFNIGHISQALDLSPREIRDLLSQSLTFAQMAEREQVPLETVLDALVKPLSKKLKDLIRKGYVTEDDAAEKLDEARSSMSRALREFRIALGQAPDVAAHQSGNESDRLFDGIPVSLSDVADLLAVDAAALRQRVRDGEQIEHILADVQADPEAFTRGITRLAQRRLVDSDENGDSIREGLDRALKDLEDRILGPAEAETPGATSTSSDRSGQKAPKLAKITGWLSVLRTLGLDLATIRELNAEGYSLAGIASKQGFDGNSTVDRIVSIAKEQVDAAIQGGGLSEGDGAELLGSYQEQVETVVARLFEPASAPESSSDTTNETTGATTSTTRSSSSTVANRPPVARAILYPIETEDDGGTFKVISSGSDRDRNLDTVVAVILAPYHNRIDVRTEVKKRLKVQFERRVVRIEAPDPQAVLDDITEFGGIVVSNGQRVRIRIDEDSDESVYRYRSDGTLVVESPRVTLRVTATDTEGASDSAKVRPAF